MQKRLARLVRRSDRFGPIRRVAGADAAYRNGCIRAAVVLLSWPDLEPIEESLIERPVGFPYIPGLLSFREVPALLEGFERLSVAPDLIFCDAHGFAHPRRFGMASHLGVVLDIPTIGCAKTLLCGEHDPVPPGRGHGRPLWHKGRRVGTVLRTRDGVKPVYVSVGHRVSLPTAVRFILRAARTRIPEPIRLADRLSKRRP